MICSNLCDVRWRCFLRGFLMCSSLIMLYYLVQRKQQEEQHISERANDMKTVVFRENELVFLIILCSGEEQVDRKVRLWDGGRQVRQAKVLMKSAAALSQRPLRFLVVSDPKDHFDNLTTYVAEWPDQYRQRVRLEYYPVWYPPGRSSMRTFDRECGTEVLFAPDMLSHEDAVIYLDTDNIFMTSPEDLWNIFTHFTPSQVAAMCPNLFYYNDPARTIMIPFFGSSGLNSGNILMNLTRQRRYPGGGWTKAILATYDKYLEDIVLGDQDILNAHFSQSPDRLLEMGCDWNFRRLQCRGDQNMCPITNTEGASIIHGNNGVFLNDDAMEFKAVFEPWENYQLGDSLQRLYTSITERLQKITTEPGKLQCSGINDTETVFSYQLLKHIRMSKRG